MERSPLSHDTSLEADRVRIAILQRMTPHERAARFFEFSRQRGRLLEEGVRRRHPEYTASQVKLAVARLMLGRELCLEVYGRDIEP